MVGRYYANWRSLFSGSMVNTYSVGNQIKIEGIIVSMDVLVNGDLQALTKGTSLQNLLVSLQMSQGRIAVEINGQIIPKSRFQQHQLRDGDKIEIVQAIGGG